MFNRTIEILGVPYKLFGMREHGVINRDYISKMTNKFKHDCGLYDNARAKLSSYSGHFIAYAFREQHGFVDDMEGIYKSYAMRDSINYHRLLKRIKFYVRKFVAKLADEMSDYCLFNDDPQADADNARDWKTRHAFLILRNYVVNYVLGYYPAWHFVVKGDNEVSRFHGMTMTGYYAVSHGTSDQERSVFDFNLKAMINIFAKLKRQTTKVTIDNANGMLFTKNARDVLNKHIPKHMWSMANEIMVRLVSDGIIRVMMKCIRENTDDQHKLESPTNFSLDMSNYSTLMSNQKSGFYATQSCGLDLGEYEWNKEFRKHRWRIASSKHTPEVTRTVCNSATINNEILNQSSNHTSKSTAAGCYWFKGIDAGVKFEHVMNAMYKHNIDKSMAEKICVAAYVMPKNWHHRKFLNYDCSLNLTTANASNEYCLLQYIRTPYYKHQENYPKPTAIYEPSFSARFFDRVFSRGLTWSGGLTTHVYGKPRDIGHDMIVYDGVRIDQACPMNERGATAFQKYIDTGYGCISQRQHVFVKHRPSGITFAINCDTIKRVTGQWVNGSYVMSNIPSHDDVCQHDVSSEIIDAFRNYLVEMETIDSVRIFSQDGRKLHDLVESECVNPDRLQFGKFRSIDFDECDSSVATSARAAVKKFHKDSGDAIATTHDCRMLAYHIIAPIVMAHTINTYNTISIKCVSNRYISRTGLKTNCTHDDDMNETKRLIVSDSMGEAVTEHPIPSSHRWRNMINNHMDARNDMTEVMKAAYSSVNFPQVIRSKSIFNK